MDDVYKNIEEYNPNKRRKIIIVFDDMINDILSNKKLNPIATGLLIRGRKLNISLVFTTQSFLLCQYYTQFYELLYFENTKQTRISRNCI